MVKRSFLHTCSMWAKSMIDCMDRMVVESKPWKQMKVGIGVLWDDLFPNTRISDWQKSERKVIIINCNMATKQNLTIQTQCIYVCFSNRKISESPQLCGQITIIIPKPETAGKFYGAFPLLLLMEEFRNNGLGCIKPKKNTEINCLSLNWWVYRMPEPSPVVQPIWGFSQVGG